MDNRTFAQQILAQISGAQSGMAVLSCPAAVCEDPRILVIAALPAPQAIPILQEAVGLLRFGERIEPLVTEEVAARLHNPLLSTEAPSCWDGIRAVLAIPDQNQLAHMALGLQDCAAARTVLQALWRGVPVYLDLSCAESCGGMSCASSALQVLYASYAEKLLEMGARHVLPGEYLSMLRQSGAARDSAAQKPAEQAHVRMVVTGSDVIARSAQDAVWELPEDAIVTPHARDLAKKHGLQLKRGAERTKLERRSNDGAC